MNNLYRLIQRTPETITALNPEQIHSIDTLVRAVRLFHQALGSNDPVASKIKNQFVVTAEALTMWGDSFRFFSEANGPLMNNMSNGIGITGSLGFFYSIPATWEITNHNQQEVETALLIIEKLGIILNNMKQNPLNFSCTALRVMAAANENIRHEFSFKIKELMDVIITAQRGAQTLLPLRLAFFKAVQNLEQGNAATEQAVITALDNIFGALDTSFNYIKIFSPYSYAHHSALPEQREEPIDALFEAGESQSALDEQSSQEREPNEMNSFANDMAQCDQIDTRLQRVFIHRMLKNVTLCLSLKSLHMHNEAQPFSPALINKMNAIVDQINQNQTITFRGQHFNLMEKHSEYRIWFENCGLPRTDNHLAAWEGAAQHAYNHSNNVL